MITFSDKVPTVYTNTSRDFQYLSWLINIVLNSVKHNVDGLYNLPNIGTESRLAELLAMTLGFKVKRNYDQKQLSALVSIIPTILRYKGTITAIKIACDALVTASGARGDFLCEVEDNQLNVLLPKDLVDTTLFIDLLDYILPAGMTYRILRKPVASNTLKTHINYYDTIYYEVVDDLSWNDENMSNGLSGLFVADPTNPEFNANFKTTADEPDGHKLNAGLLNNTVIPVLDN